ncbi:hypothetical protein [Aliikangiella sp. G2MR2-5]|uniref:hypothetical protein n=1 Tax=Aliikangiella sp. G2MR2-5 TaxID=2788943 RepID=UPI0018AA96C3|nr:hypothetical protein [Aliikangiella sp. G2MR2-5]
MKKYNVKPIALGIMAIAFSASVYASNFYRAYCDTEDKYLGQWSNDETVANNSANHHLRNNSNHSVSIKTK